MIFLKKILLPVIALLFIPSTLFCQNARGIENTVRYEGSVSVGWSWAITLNLETVHGVRFSGSNVFIGGQAGLSFGIPQGVEPPSVTAGRKNYAGGVDLMPEFGLGFKLRNGDAVDLAVRCQLAFGLYDAYKSARGWLGAEYYPALMVGYRF